MKAVSINKTTNPFGSPQLVPRSLKRKKFGTEFDENKKTLVLDLDQTLIYLTVDVPSKETNFVEIPDQGKFTSFAIKRPGLDQFMKEMSAIFNICIYTANKTRYANDIVKAVGLTPYIFEVYTREHCTKVSEKMYMKSLLNLGFSLANTIFVDDSAIQMRSQPLNSILIQSFKGEIGDSALIYLSPFLKHVSTLNDVRPVTEKLFDFYDQSSNNPKKKRSSKTKKSSPKSTNLNILPLISEEKEEDDNLEKPRTIRKKAITFGSEALKSDGSEPVQVIYDQTKETTATGSQTKRSLSLPTQNEIEKMYSQSGPLRVDSIKKCDSLTEL